MGVGADHVVQIIHPHVFQIGHHQTAVRHVASVNEHEFSVTLNQGAVRLAHVNEVDREVGAIRHRQGGGLGLSLIGHHRREQNQHQNKT